VSIRRKGRKQGYQVRVYPFPALTVPSKQAALKLEAQLILRRSLGDLYEEPATTLGAEIDGLIAWKQAAGSLSDKGLLFLRQSAKQWRPLRERTVSSLRRAEIEDQITARAVLHPRSAKNELQFLKAVLKRAIARGQRVDERILAIEPIRHQARQGKALTPAQLDFLASWQPERLRRFVLLAGTIGLRASELYSLQDQQLELDAQPEALLRIPHNTPGNKAKKDKTIPLTPRERTLFREQLLLRPARTPIVFPREGGSAYDHHFRDDVWLPARTAAISAWQKEHNLPESHPTPFDDLHVHDLRHTAISLMCKAGYRPEWVAERVGHNDGGALILRRYRHLYPNEMTQASQNLDTLLQANNA
jgi:integrase